MVTAALIMGGATLVGGAVSANASRKATNKAVQADALANSQNTALIRDQMARADAATAPLTPYAAAGAARLASRVGIATPPTNALQSGNAYAAPGADITAANYYSPSGQPLRTPYDIAPADAAAGMYTSGNAYAAAGNPASAEQAAANYTGSTGTPTRRAMDEGTGGGAGYMAPGALQPGYGAGAGAANYMPYDANNPNASVSMGAGSAGGTSPGTYGNTANPSYTAPTYQDPGKFSYTAADYQESPGFQFQLSRGLDAIQSAQANRGAMYSGATAKALTKFATGLANQEFNNERNFAAGQFTENANRSRANFDADRNYGTARYVDDRNYLTGRYDRETGDLLNLTGIGQQAVNQQLGQYASGTNALIQGNNQTATTVGNAAFANANTTAGLVNNALQAGGNVMGAYMGNAYANNGLVNSLSGGQLVKPNNLALNTRTNAYSGLA